MLAANVNDRSTVERISGRLTYSLENVFSSERFLVYSVQRDIARASRLTVRGQKEYQRHLLIPTVGKGNIGDQAMLEAFLLNTTWAVTLVVEHRDGHIVPADATDRVRTVVMPELFASRPWVRRRIRRDLGNLIARHTTLSVIGADVMDGGYGSAEATVRYGLLCTGNEVGTPNRVLGFSWNGVPPREVQRALRLSQPNSLLCLRDPHSATRLQAEGNYNVVSTADVAFTLNTIEPYDRIRAWLDEQIGRRLVIVNVSGILARKGVPNSEYVQIVRHLVERGCSVALLPHVIREGDDDLSACTAVTAELGPTPRVHLIEDLLTPSQVAWLARQAAAVLTGRMHLSILSLNQGVASAVLSTQGKVSGLMALFDLPELCLEPNAGFALPAMRTLDRIFDDPSIRMRLEESLPEVRRLARLNFAGLEQSVV